MGRQTLSKKYAYYWVLGTFTVGATLSAPSMVFADSLYRCLDSNGRVMYTDRPAQIPQCERMSGDAGRVPAPSLPPVLPVPPVRSEMSVPPTPTPDTNLSLAETAITIPVRKIGHLFVVPVELNSSKTAHLILDTGASHTILSQELVRELALIPSDFQPGLVTLKTAGGTVDAQMIHIDSMKIATAEVRHSSAAVHTVPDSPAGVDGLLGLSFLRQFEVTLDTARSELRLRRPVK